MKTLVRILVSAAALWCATALLSGIDAVGPNGFWPRVGVFLVVATVFTLVNAIVKPVIALLSMPLYVLTLGLFTLVVNALMLMLTAWITGFLDWGITVDSFGWAVIGALIVSIASLILNAIVKPERR